MTRDPQRLRPDFSAIALDPRHELSPGPGRREPRRTPLAASPSSPPSSPKATAILIMPAPWSAGPSSTNQPTRLRPRSWTTANSSSMRPVSKEPADPAPHRRGSRSALPICLAAWASHDEAQKTAATPWPSPTSTRSPSRRPLPPRPGPGQRAEALDAPASFQTLLSNTWKIAIRLNRTTMARCSPACNADEATPDLLAAAQGDPPGPGSKAQALGCRLHQLCAKNDPMAKAVLLQSAPHRHHPRPETRRNDLAGPLPPRRPRTH